MKIKGFIILVFFQILVSTKSFAQDPDEYAWWVKVHNWDGYTPWQHMITTSAAYFGPNALPVPSINDALTAQKFNLEFRPEAHLMKGDHTLDLFTSLSFPLGKRADFEVFIVPLEYYEMDTVIRDIRFVRHRDLQGFAGGDFWLGTNIQLLRDHTFLPDIVASFYFKTASGTALEWARYTDAPGYYIHLSFGKDIYKIKDKNINFRLLSQGGIYVYQTWSLLNPQNDAISYGFGIKASKADIYFITDVAGYYGYWGTGDRPEVFRFEIGNQNKKINFALKYQAGIHDFKYQTVGFSTTFVFGK